MPDQRDLELLIRSEIPLIAVPTHEEPRVLSLLLGISARLGMPLHHWTATRGLQRVGQDFEPDVATVEPTELLVRIKTTSSPGLYLLADFHPYLDNAIHVRLLKDLALAYGELRHTIVLASHAIDIPPEIERFSARFELSLPDRNAVRDIVLDEARRWSRSNAGRNVSTSRKNLDRLVDNLVGLAGSEARRLARGAICVDGAITDSDLPAVMKAKFELLGQDGVLSFEYDTARFADVGGLAHLKSWLALREPVFSGGVNRPGLDVPKGVMLLGVQGCGKSLAAKAVAGAWGVPLLRLDFGALYNKYHGETERNLRESLRQAEIMAPCVLWVDEIEKGIATGDSDSGTSKRVLGTLLTWMAESANRVFVVATANDVTDLPPELLRKGRLDEIFFVDLPDEATRREILGIHLTRRALDPDACDVVAVAAACGGFSGAEIEQLVVSALYTAYARGATLDTAALIDEARRTRPLSVVMAERISALRAWAAERTVPAN